MTKYIWAIDTPWAKKGELVADTTNTKQVMPSHKDIINRLLVIGWIKPVEEEPQEKKLTDNNLVHSKYTGSTDGSEILGRSGCGYAGPNIKKKLTEEDIRITITSGTTHTILDAHKLAKFLAEHLK